MLRRALLVLASLSMSVACSAIVSPDEGRIGGGVDSGALPVDSGPPDERDTGTPTTDAGPTGRDAGPPGRDAGPPGRDAGPPEDDAGQPSDAGGPPDSGPPDAGVCTTPTVCADGQLVGCDGVEACRLGCAPNGEPRCARMAPSNFSSDRFDAAAPPLIIDPGDSAEFDTSACAGVSVNAQVLSQNGGVPACVITTSGVQIGEGARLRILGDRPLVVLVDGDAELGVGAVIDVSAREINPGPGGGLGAPFTMTGAGAGPSGGGAGGQNRLDDGGGGGGGFCGRGGDGGAGGRAPGGSGGAPASASRLLQPLSGGSGGGLGLGRIDAGGYTTGLGGGGGGALQISVTGELRLLGEILAGGGGGHGGVARMNENFGAGGGGGSGGGVLIEAVSLVTADSTAVTTSGGGGGGSASFEGVFVSGTHGTDGAVTLGRAAGGMSGGDRFGADGGRSGGGQTHSGEDGSDNPGDRANGGGGGGGVGCVVFRTADGGLPTAGTFSARDQPGLQSAPVHRF